MGLVSRLIGSSEPNDKKTSATASSDVVNGALDTLGELIRVLGNQAFPLDNETDAAGFTEICDEFARHVENGAAVTSRDIPASADGKREWGQVRRFFADRRQDEKRFVTERLHGYRGIVDELVSGLRDIGIRDNDTETSVRESLQTIETAVQDGALPRIKEALAQTVSQVNETFAKQKREYEQKLRELNDGMSNLREDLVAAREEMKRDALTEAFNRGAFDTAIAQCLNVHFILKQPVSLLMIDLDKFKEVNDGHGHAAGDAVLRVVGECLARSFIRKNDLVARYGGDEFAVILPDTSAKHAGIVVERFIKMIRETRVAVQGGEVEISCSVGYTEIVAEDTVESFVNRADKALYQAKAEGRDQGVLISA